ncbi:hypothetical protein QTN25_010192 [Entamoeba marina]
MKNLTVLVLSHPSDIEACNEFNLLTYLMIKQCKNISFKQHEEKVFHYSLPCIQKLEIINSKHVECLFINQSSDIKIEGIVDNIENVFISYSKNCLILSKLLKSDTKTIENSNITLLDKKLNEPSNYETLELHKLSQSYFCTLSNPKWHNDELFRVKGLTLLTITVEVNNNSYSKIDKYPFDEFMISNEFHNSNNKTKQVVWSNDKQIELLASIHYFEVEIFGYAIIQIGLFNRPLKPFVVNDLVCINKLIINLLG